MGGRVETEGNEFGWSVRPTIRCGLRRMCAAAWGPCEGDCPEDLDGSGIVDFGDLLILLSAWGPCE